MRKFILIIAAVAAVFACGPRKVQDPDAQEFAPYVKAFTGGIVGEDAVLLVELAQNATAQPTEGLFSFKPGLKGSVKWNGEREALFIPAEGALKVGETYQVNFALGKVLEGAPEKFPFGFTVKGEVSGEADAQEEPDNGEAFRVVRARETDKVIEVELSEAPANANVKGMVELKGAARSYVQVQENTVLVHFEGKKNTLTLTLDRGLKGVSGAALGKDFVRAFSGQEEKPALEIPFQGNILPDRQKLILPFRAVNLSAVEVRVVKIYEKNILMFLQDNNLGGDAELRRSGRLVYKADIPLDPTLDLHRWNTHCLDLSGLFKEEPGAIYRIRLSFRMDQSLYGGKEAARVLNQPSGKPTPQDEKTWDQPLTYYWENFYDWDSYVWDEAEDPTKPSYYMDAQRFPAVQLLASDLGLMASYAGGDRLWVTATDLLSAKPVPGAKLEVYDFQLQSIGSGKTDGSGMATLNVSRRPFAVVAKAGGSSAYLKITDGTERPMSRFDVGGEQLQQGLKAFLYGERGVWRPGDTLHVTAIVEDRGKTLPQGHPATLEVYTPEGQFYGKYTRKGTDGFFAYDIPTKESDPTGYWNAYLKVGGSSYHKVLHIESIKPNRLKINTRYPALLEGGKTAELGVNAAWLSGAVAGSLPARAKITLRKAGGSPFEGWEKYQFYAPAEQYGGAENEIFNTRLDENGALRTRVILPSAQGAPGPLQAFVVTSVEEAGGDESFTTETLPYSPYPAYVGIRVPDGEYLETDKNHHFSLAVVSPSGKRLTGRKVEYAVYKTGWSWWWDNSGESLDTYVNGSSVEKVQGGTLTVGAKDTSFSFRVDYPSWGRYMVLARDLSSGHVAGAAFTVDWPDYRGRAGRGDPETLTMITLSTDKPAYKVGEKATVYIPGARGGKALVSVENSTGILQREWVSTGAGDTPWSFTVTPDMAPNVYVQASLLQPYGASENDLPLRLYGALRVKVENPLSHLEPVVQLPAVIHPQEPFVVKVSEKSGRPMTYTLAIVDEGLLDVTAFKTPDPWSRMYRPEALAFKTWDLYDDVIGAFSGKFSPLAAIGGDEDLVRSARKDNRFNPVVLYQGPRTLSKGVDAIKLTLPMYVGSVRVMLVAAHQGAYGNAEKTVPVQNPLMVVTSAPRVLGCGEEISATVNVFAMEDGIGDVSVTVKADGPLTGGATQRLNLPAKGDRVLRFPLKATKAEGTARITVTAEGGGHKASEVIALPVRNPYPEVTSVERFTLAKGASREVSGQSLQLAGFPAVDVQEIYRDMRDYPYNCSEQLSARGLALLHLLPLLPQEDAAKAKELIPGLVAALYARQNADGGFAYWSGGSSDTWVSSMAGAFLSEAAKAGFEVNAGVVQSWKNYQQRMTQVFRLSGSSFFSQADEAFRLYTLAAAGAPNLSGMNRLKESGELGHLAGWLLSAAYALSGKQALGQGLLDGASSDYPEYEPYNLTYGTALRDRFVAIDALALNGNIADALALCADIPARKLSTQESAFATLALDHLAGKTGLAAPHALVGGKEVAGAASVVSVPLSGKTEVENRSVGTLYGTVLSVSREATEKALSSGIAVEVKWMDEAGAPVNPATLKQGTRFTAVIKVTGSPVRDHANLVLDAAIPSGWEIENERLSGGVSSESGYDYKDIRDDRVLWYFGLPAGFSKTFRVQLRAAYEGSYVLPSLVCKALYDPSTAASTASGTATVTR